MKQTLTTSEAADLLRSDANAGWSYAGARALVEFLEAEEQSLGEEMEFDRVAIRCEFSEFPSALAAASEYDFEPDEGDELETPEEREERIEAEALQFLQDSTDCIEFGGGIIIRQF